MTPIGDAFADALADLPVQHIHGDCHGSNILLHDGTVYGATTRDAASTTTLASIRDHL